MPTDLNRQVAAILRQNAGLLEQQQVSHHRIGAFRRAADTLDALEEDLEALCRRADMATLVALPGVGRGIARAIYEMITRGRSTRLESLRGLIDPERGGLAADTAHQPFRLTVHGALLQHRPGSRAGAHRRLGRDLLRRRASRRAVHGGDRDLGPAAGRERVVRGREPECREHYGRSPEEDHSGPGAAL